MPVSRKISALTVVLLLALSIGCGGPGPDDSSAEGLPELTDELIRERLNGVRFGPVPPEEGSGEPISWRFFLDEPKEITIVEKNVQGTSANVVLDIKTTSSPRSREPRQLSGRIRTEWQLNSGMVLRQWEVVRTENLTVKYRNLPKPSPEPSKPD
jgi:hypothetical protein